MGDAGGGDRGGGMVRGVLAVGWRLASMLVMALALISLTSRWHVVSWNDAIASVATEYQAITDPIARLMARLIPLDMPAYTVDLVVLYLLIGNAFALFNIAAERGSEGRIQHSVGVGILLQMTFFWPYMIFWTMQRVTKDAQTWSSGLAMTLISVGGAFVAFVGMIIVATLIQSAIFWIALAANHWL